MSKTNIFTLELLFSPPSLLHLPSSFYQTAAPYTGYLGEILETQSRFCLLYSLRAIQQQILEAFIFQVYPVLNAFSLSLLLLPGPCYHLLPPGLVNQLVNYSFLRVICNILYCSILLLNNNQERAFKNINGISISLALYDQAPKMAVLLLSVHPVPHQSLPHRFPTQLTDLPSQGEILISRCSWAWLWPQVGISLSFRSERLHYDSLSKRRHLPNEGC